MHSLHFIKSQPVSNALTALYQESTSQQCTHYTLSRVNQSAMHSLHFIKSQPVSNALTTLYQESTSQQCTHCTLSRANQLAMFSLHLFKSQYVSNAFTAFIKSQPVSDALTAPYQEPTCQQCTHFTLSRVNMSANWWHIHSCKVHYKIQFKFHKNYRIC